MGRVQNEPGGGNEVITDGLKVNKENEEVEGLLGDKGGPEDVAHGMDDNRKGRTIVRSFGCPPPHCV